MTDKDELKRKLGQQLAPLIKQAIDDSSWNQGQIAEKLGVSEAAVSKWCRFGKIELPHLYELARVTGKQMGHFFPGLEERPAGQPRGNIVELGQSIEEVEILQSALLIALKAKVAASKKS